MPGLSPLKQTLHGTTLDATKWPFFGPLVPRIPAGFNWDRPSYAVLAALPCLKFRFVSSPPNVENAREIWENERWEPGAQAWRETSRTIEWQTKAVDKTAQAVEKWHDDHPVRSFLIDKGLQEKPAALESLEQEHSQAERFLQGSQKTLDKLENAWSARQPAYEQKLESQGRQIEEARENLKVIQENPEHFKEVFEHEHNQFQERIQAKMSRAAAQREPPSRSEKPPEREKEPERDRDRGHDRDDGWSR